MDDFNGDDTKKLCQSRLDGLEMNIIYHRATTTGTAAQHDLAMQLATQEVI